MIGNDDVASEYKKLLLELGVDYSPHKTLTSKTCFEFAKRIFRNNKEISPISLSAFKESASA